MKPRSSLLLLPLASLALMGCVPTGPKPNSASSSPGAEPSPEQVRSLTAPQGPPRLYVAVLDWTGSTPYFPEARRKLLELTRIIRPEDLLYVYYLGSAQNEKNDLIVQPNQDLLTKLMSVDTKSHYCPEADLYWRDYYRQIQALVYQQATGSDVYGALFLASRCLNSADLAGFEKHLFIFSDLGDTVGNNSIFNGESLENVHVRVLYYPTKVDKLSPNGTLIQSGQSQADWNNLFTKLGAASVQILDPGMSTRYNVNTLP